MRNSPSILHVLNFHRVFFFTHFTVFPKMMFFELLLSKGNLGNGIGNTFLVTTIFFILSMGTKWNEWQVITST